MPGPTVFHRLPGPGLHFPSSPAASAQLVPLLVPNFSANLVDLGQFGKVPPPSEIKDVLRLALRLALCILRRSILLYIYIITY